MSDADALRALGLEVSTRCACLALRKAARTVTQAYDAALRPIGLRATQFTVLTALAIAGEAPLTKIGAKLAMDRTTLTRNLGPLERAGLVTRGAGATDRRRRVVRLTPRGAAMLRRGIPRWRAAQKKLLAALGDPTWQSLALGLARLVSPKEVPS